MQDARGETRRQMSQNRATDIKSLQDRRRARRVKRLISLSFEHAEKRVTCVSTDLSLSGAFVNTPPNLHIPTGTRLVIEYRDGHGNPIRIGATVTRMITRASRVSHLPGMAVEFSEIVSVLGREPLDNFLRMLDWPGQGMDGRFTRDHYVGTATWHTPQAQGGLKLIPRTARQIFEARLSNGHALPENPQTIETLLKKLASDVERRRKCRYPLRIDVTYYPYEQHIPHLGTVMNISERGLFVQTSHELPQLGERVTLNFPVSNEPDVHTVKIRGKVRRHWEPDAESLPGFGIHFEVMDERGRTGIFRMFLRRLGGTRQTRPRRGYHYSMVR